MRICRRAQSAGTKSRLVSRVHSGPETAPILTIDHICGLLAFENNSLWLSGEWYIIEDSDTHQPTCSKFRHEKPSCVQGPLWSRNGADFDL